MAQALQIDTLAFSKKLREAGADEGLAEAIVEGLTAADTSNLATKTDVTDAESRLKAEIASVGSSLKTEIASVESSLRAEIAEVKTDLSWIKMIGGAIVALLILPWLAELAKVALN